MSLKTGNGILNLSKFRI